VDPQYRNCLISSFWRLELLDGLLLLLLDITRIFTATEFLPRGSSPYTSTYKKMNRIIHKQNSNKIQYKQYKTQQIQVRLLPKHA
jgi:hypothetical protein